MVYLHTHLIDDADEFLLGNDDVLESGAGFVKVLELPR
jgi:hypothetical protein